jgi:MYXO-CTERM domain-containing protein
MKGTICSFLVGLALLLVPQQGHAVAFTVDSATAAGGNMFSINLHVANAINLTSWQVDLAYNPTLLKANLVTEGPFLSSFGTTSFGPGVIDNTTGQISLVTNAFVDVTPPPNGSGVLASVQFTAWRPGVSPLTASNVFLNFLDSGFSVTNGAVSVGGASAPEPPTVALLGVGLVVLYLAHRRQRLGKGGR